MSLTLHVRVDKEPFLKICNSEGLQTPEIAARVQASVVTVRTTVRVGRNRREAQTKEELMVSNDVMRLEVKRLRDTLNGAADEVFSLENRRQQLAMSMKERKAEIQVTTYLFVLWTMSTSPNAHLAGTSTVGHNQPCEGRHGTRFATILKTQTVFRFEHVC